MSTATTLHHRDRAALRAVAAGRCALAGPTLLVDGLCCADQFLAARLTDAALIDATTATGTASLTATGRAALDVA
ncbi:hypothetical protein I4I73_14035 [Pseudonocardia sp. KRD-184]|uniref:Uncharacterized protein n=1 Tax=Pseudonocardia oceani TaxID=2792013 RepID=A0ABS6UHE9_9PSEU|nr:hypothetical protein [Pseudonocardia oceani]MBW0091303.1 hypothetical protein [Pseudonocardia oceani]MBW0097109.1 hypothetical protein [Pseudonocardia oceani]MBW0110902.1 hypothetical protein [Pseudonocardia oceani]MBW0123938.1 hypothetical protein [Pseudonocardia oceani]MBW0131661.1 hypothetical protein [Pseudonocardia oceani]